MPMVGITPTINDVLAKSGCLIYSGTRFYFNAFLLPVRLNATKNLFVNSNYLDNNPP